MASRIKKMAIGLPFWAIASVIWLALAGTATAGAKPGDGEFELSAKMNGKAISGGDTDGRGRVSLDFDRGAREVCFDMRVVDAKKGRLFVGEGAVGDEGDPVLTLLGRSERGEGRIDCVNGVSRGLIREIGADPEDFFVELDPNASSKGEIGGQLSRDALGDSTPNGLVDCNLTVYNDTGMDILGTRVPPAPPDGTGTRTTTHNSGGDILGGFCQQENTYEVRDSGGLVRSLRIFIKDPVYGSNTYFCNAQGDIRCFGPRAGSTLSGYTLSVIYYVCIPSAWPQNPAYCTR